MSCTEGNKKGRAVRNSNCNGIDMADDARERIKRENEWTMRHPVPTQADVGKYIVVNIGALGRDLSELGLYESARQVGRTSKWTIRYAGTIVGVTSNLIFIERFFPHAKNIGMNREFEGCTYTTKMCCEQLSAFECGYARYVCTEVPFLKHLLLQTGGGRRKSMPSHFLIYMETMFNRLQRKRNIFNKEPDVRFFIFLESMPKNRQILRCNCCKT